ncbi:MAG: MFS transporter [Thermoleophilia bacterium]|nr:MFS transporter [Thermoleophilia bacterium]
MPTPPHLVRQRNGVLLLAVQFLHALAQGMSVIVLPWIVLDAGASVAGAGLVLTAGFLPFALFGLPAGVVGDRGRRRPMLGAVLAAQSLVAVAACVAAGAGGLPTMGVLAVAFLLGTGRVFVDAAMFGAVGAMVRRDGMLSAQAAVAGAFNLGYYGGPAIGGLVIGLAGARTALAAIAASLVAGCVLSLALRGAAAGRDRREAATGMGDGLRLLFVEPTLRALAIIAFTWSLMASGVITLAMPHLRRGLGLEGPQVSLVLAVGVVAMMVAPFLLHRLSGRVPDTRILVLGLCLYLVPCVAFGGAANATLATVAYGPLMMANAICAATIIGARARRTPAHLQAMAGVSGRMLVIGGFTAGSALTSALTQWVSIGTVYLLIGLGMTALAAVAAPGLAKAREASRLAGSPAFARGG